MYCTEDDLAQIRWLAAAFADLRYVRTEGGHVFLILAPEASMHALRSAAWRRAPSQLEADEVGPLNHSISLSALMRIEGGTVMPMSRAVFLLITNS